jgi:hypothetical protein
MGLDGIPIYVNYTLCASSEGWVTALAEQYETSQEDIVQNCLQLGRYIGRTYPWSHKPRASYVGSIMSTVRLRARVTQLQEKCTQISQDQKSLIAEVEFLHKLHVDKLGGDSEELPFDVDDETHPLEGPAAISFVNIKPNPRHQAFAGDIVYYLFKAAIARNEDPGIIIRKLVEAARFLDSNFPDLEVPTLRERLLLKVMQQRNWRRSLIGPCRHWRHS